MADQTKGGIAWTEQTWNPIRGCSRVSEGCRHCYAETVAHRFSGKGQPYEGLTNGHGMWNGAVRMVPEHLDDPIHWTRPRMVFVNSMSDLFHEELALEQIGRIFATMALSPQHTFQVLTKRSVRMSTMMGTDRFRDYVSWAVGQIPITNRTDTRNVLPYLKWPLPNVWLGTSVEDQETADNRIPWLLQTQAAVRWVSYEPALGPVDFTGQGWISCFHPTGEQQGDHSRCAPMIDWIVVGGESGAGARTFDLEWGYQTIAQCKEAGRVACFIKQIGSRPRPVTARHSKGADMMEWPEGLRVREYPRGA
jgi:protein gp37